MRALWRGTWVGRSQHSQPRLSPSPRTRKNICKSSNELRADLSTRTESLGRAPEYCKEGKQLSSRSGGDGVPS